MQICIEYFVLTHYKPLSLKNLVALTYGNAISQSVKVKNTNKAQELVTKIFIKELTKSSATISIILGVLCARAMWPR